MYPLFLDINLGKCIHLILHINIFSSTGKKISSYNLPYSFRKK